MYCPKCGAQLPKGTKYCSSCGYDLSKETGGGRRSFGDSKASEGASAEKRTYTFAQLLTGVIPGRPGFLLSLMSLAVAMAAILISCVHPYIAPLVFSLISLVIAVFAVRCGKVNLLSAASVVLSLVSIVFSFRMFGAVVQNTQIYNDRNAFIRTVRAAIYTLFNLKGTVD